MGSVTRQLLSDFAFVRLQLRGKIVTGASTDTGFLPFLEHTYPVWDRKFGDPRALPDSGSTAAPKKFNGKLEGNWIFPFSIPFPTNVNLSTLSAVYSREEEGPVRFLPQFLGEEGPITPFITDGPLTEAPNSTAAGSVPTLTPFHFGQDLHDLAHKHSQSSTYSSLSEPPQVAARTPVLSPFLTSPIPNSSSDSGLASLPQGKQIRTHEHKIPGGSPDRRGDIRIDTSSSPHSSEGAALPPTFLEREVRASIRYELELVISHGTFSTESR